MEFNFIYISSLFIMGSCAYNTLNNLDSIEKPFQYGLYTPSRPSRHESKIFREKYNSFFGEPIKLRLTLNRIVPITS